MRKIITLGQIETNVYQHNGSRAKKKRADDKKVIAFEKVNNLKDVKKLMIAERTEKNIEGILKKEDTIKNQNPK
ncbi:44941_t:CDS:2 [Gigaspora margarita]|uniref:44941_t:CDS:1 n=1 Tax=Gigaspora margarita TaxID=4874 RepID=A0ABN7UNB2_GIGMA|nr:44941_t:CDS:2 [Gigaspora margarita]